MQWFAHLHHREPGEASAPKTRGVVITSAWRYDFLMRLVGWFFHERALRQTTADLAHLHPGEAVLDVGCGTGAMAIVAKERVGETGHVSGIDPSVQMIALARRKVARRGLSIDLRPGVIEQLVFPNQSFDVVLSTMMMHQLPDDLKRQGLAEIARVLKPGGRLLVLDFRRAEEGEKPRFTHTGLWNSGIQDQPALLQEAGFSQIETGKTRFFWGQLCFALGRVGSKGAAQER